MSKLLLDFKPLPHAKWINNCEIPVNEHFKVSVSYNLHPGLFNVGDINDYEVAIKVTSNTSPYDSLVSFENIGSNLFHHCTENDILNLIETAKTLSYVGEILVFDKLPNTKEKDWNHRFYCAKGFDLQYKLDYCNRIWDKSEVKLLVNPHE